MRATALKRSPAPPMVPPTPEAPRLMPPRRPRSSSRWDWVIGLVVSGLLHLLLLILAARIFVVPQVWRGTPPAPAAQPATSEMQVVWITPVPEAAASETPVREETSAEAPGVRPEATPDERAPGAPGDRVAPGPGVPGAGAPTGRAAPAERLRPRIGDARLWARPEAPPPPPEPTDIEQARQRIYSRLGEINDSLAAEGAIAASATDWTVKDGDGGRWGFSPGKIHLGDITLPLPFGFSTPPGRRDEVQERQQKDAEIQHQAGRDQARENREERIKAIRERKEKERGKSGSGTGTGAGTGSKSGSGSTTGSGSRSGAGSAPGSGSGS